MKNLLVFAHECAPFNRRESTIGAQRPAQFARHLTAFGWRAVVLCCDAERRGTAPPGDRGAVRAALQAEVRERLRAAPDDQPVVIATPSLAWDGLLDRAWHAAAGPEQGSGGALRTAVRRPLTAAKLWTGDYSQSWQPCARWAAEAVTEVIGVDACLGEHSPDAGLFLARWFARRASGPGIPWIADFRDPILQPLTPMAQRLYRPLARHLVRSAVATVAVNPRWAELDRELFGRPAFSIPNGSDPEELAAAPAVPRDGRLTVTYAGNVLLPAHLDVFLAGLALARRRVPGEAPGIVFRYRGLAAADVARRAGAQGVGDLCDIAGYCPRPETLGLVRASDLLLLLSCADPRDPYRRDGLYPGKVFECFAARRPILCVAGDGVPGGQLDALLAETRTGAVYPTPDAVADALLAARRLQQAGQSLLYQPDEAALARYTRRALAGRLAEVLDRAVAGLLDEAIRDAGGPASPDVESSDPLDREHVRHRRHAHG
jgi:glycosyltransferase involved in cell wall biosynthesis